MKKVILSVNPEWCEFIFSGLKTVEFRKSAPAGNEPFKVFVYCTKNGKDIFVDGARTNGFIMGSFICNNVYKNVQNTFDDSGIHNRQWFDV